ncbi:MAG: homoserine O-acetyltransferase [Thermonema sp.]|uniref:homoserine O-acetyltransferase family protein n=1 Tax=Thermonema sp. TaxID=2231181 RepID=UPI0021DD9E08|nr:homoserine O-acetyltransferase [Thermonema sp.]GIV40465.1 MAG: homoserine O-acetyltransferase [Thermonema sp.]
MLQTFQYRAPFITERGDRLEGLTVAYRTYGQLNEQADNVVWVCHALTGSADVDQWWARLFGEGRLLDPARHFIVCANMLGSCYGSTNPLSPNPSTGTPYYYDFPLLTNRDIVRGFELLRRHLGIRRIRCIIGGSMGGQQALEWLIEVPDLFDSAYLIACNARHSPWGIAFNEAQRMAIEADSSWGLRTPEAGLKGMEAARACAMLSYRHYQSYALTQSETDGSERTDDFRAASYQRYQGKKLRSRFHAFSYYWLSKAMDSHDVGRGRGGVEAALARIRAQVLVLGISTDVLFPLAEQQLLAHYIPHASLRILHSVYGHDAFLIETEAVQRFYFDYFKQSNNCLFAVP